MTTYNQLSADDKKKAREAIKADLLSYFTLNGISADRSLLPQGPALPFTEVANSVELNIKCQNMQLETPGVLWVAAVLMDAELGAAVEAEVTLRVQQRTFALPAAIEEVPPVQL